MLLRDARMSSAAGDTLTRNPTWRPQARRNSKVRRESRTAAASTISKRPEAAVLPAAASHVGGGADLECSSSSFLHAASDAASAHSNDADKLLEQLASRVDIGVHQAKPVRLHPVQPWHRNLPPARNQTVAPVKAGNGTVGCWQTTQDAGHLCTLAPLLFGKPLLNNVPRFDHAQLQK